MKKLFIVPLLLMLFAVAPVFAQDNELPIASHYTGGEKQLMHDIDSVMVYPAMAKRNRRQGTVIVKVKMNENGTLSSFSVVKNPGAGMDKEAIRILKALKFNAPGYSATYQVPVKFSL